MDSRVLSDPSLATSEKYVGTFDLGKFLDDIDVSTNFAPYVTSNRGCVVLDETGKVVYVWNSPGEPGMVAGHDGDSSRARDRKDELRVSRASGDDDDVKRKGAIATSGARVF